MEINRYIKDLLLEHDCVVIPGLGGFIGSPIGAEQQTVTKTINPPGKRITFNGQLQRNDGLLIHHVSIVEGIGYEMAEDEVLFFVKDSKKRLEQSGLIMFPEVGKLMADNEGIISFYPTPGRNLLQESFGLKPVHYRQTFNAAELGEEKQEYIPLQAARPGKGKLRRLVGTYGVSIAAMLVLGIFIGQEIYIKPLSLDQFGFFNPPAILSPAAATPKTLPSDIAGEPVMPGTMLVTGTLEANEADILIVQETEEPATATTTEPTATKTPEVAAAKETAPVKEAAPVATPKSLKAPHVTQTTTADIEAGYYMVLGAYSSKANAEKFISEQKNLSGLIIIPSNGLLRVAKPVGKDADAAYRLLEKQRQQDHPAAWLILNSK
ncbi:SPOR domain-containing protein [soil metagenome]